MRAKGRLGGGAPPSRGSAAGFELPIGRDLDLDIAIDDAELFTNGQRAVAVTRALDAEHGQQVERHELEEVVARLEVGQVERPVPADQRSRGRADLERAVCMSSGSLDLLRRRDVLSPHPHVGRARLVIARDEAAEPVPVAEGDVDGARLVRLDVDGSDTDSIPPGEGDAGIVNAKEVST